MQKPYIFRLEENKAVVRRVVEEVNKRNLTVLDDYMALDFVDHTNQVQGRENVKQGYAMIFKDFPDFHRIIEDIAAEGDKVWTLFKVTGTTISGEKMDATSITIHRIVNGKVVEGWGGLIQKLSVPKVSGELFKKLL
jgi:predicted SnoaL-like aldol condensation-catalyzing enzyme